MPKPWNVVTTISWVAIRPKQNVDSRGDPERRPKSDPSDETPMLISVILDHARHPVCVYWVKSYLPAHHHHRCLTHTPPYIER